MVTRDRNRESAYAPTPLKLTPPKFIPQIMNELRPLGDSLELLCFDPGGVTGWSLLSIPTVLHGNPWYKCLLEQVLEERNWWFHGQVDCRNDLEDKGVHFIRKALIDKFPNASIVFEDFNLRIMAADLSPIRITSKLEHHLYMRGQKIAYKQQPSMGKRVTDERLKLMSAYTSAGGLGHARDADRHMVMCLRRCMETGSKGALFRSTIWPHFYEKG